MPRYLAANRATTGGCHDFDDGHGYLRLRAPEAPPAPGTPLDRLAARWRENYLSALQLVRCDAPLESRLLTRTRRRGQSASAGAGGARSRDRARGDHDVGDAVSARSRSSLLVVVRGAGPRRAQEDRGEAHGGLRVFAQPAPSDWLLVSRRR